MALDPAFLSRNGCIEGDCAVVWRTHLTAVGSSALRALSFFFGSLRCGAWSVLLPQGLMFNENGKTNS